MATKSDEAGEIIGGLISLAVIVAIIYYAVLPVVGSFVAFKMRMSWHWEGCEYTQCVMKGFGYVRADWREREKESRDRVAGTLCPDYHEAGFIDRWTQFRNISWCADYPQYAPAAQAKATNNLFWK